MMPLSLLAYLPGSNGRTSFYPCFPKLTAALPNYLKSGKLSCPSRSRAAVHPPGSGGSSRIEGTRTSLQELLTYEARQLPLFENPDAHEVHNYVKALDFGLERAGSLPISQRLIRELHACLMEGVRGEYATPGEFRRSQNWIGGPGATIETASYVPPPVEEMHVCLNDLEKYIHSPSDLPPLIRIGLIYYQFEAIHPFLDGNGRVGRLLVSLLLSAWGLLPQPLLYLSAFFEIHRQEYYDQLLSVSQKGTWEAWLRFF